MEDPNTRNLDYLSDARELKNPDIICRKYRPIPVKDSPGVPHDAIKGYRTVKKFPKGGSPAPNA